MGRFTNGLLVGLGLAFLFTPKSGEEMRHLVGERLNSLLGSPSENGALKQPIEPMMSQFQDVPAMTEQTAQIHSTAQDYTQQTAASAEPIQHDLGQASKQETIDVFPPSQGGTPQRVRPNRSDRSRR